MGFMHRVPGGESTSTKYFLALVAVVFAFLTSGIVFGYSGLIKVFVYDVKAFAEFCEGSPPPCHAQTDRLTLMYTIAATTISGCAIFVGMFLDHFGPRITACVGSIIFALGLAALAAAAHVSSLLYYLGYFLLALAGPCIFNSLICFGELFPESSAMIIAALNGAFDSSAVVMFAFGQAVDVFGMPFQLVCLAYLVVPVTIFICSLFLFPDQPFGSGANSKNKGEIFRVWSLKHTKEVRKAKAQGIPVNAEATVPLLNDLGDKPHSDIYNTDFSQQLKSGIFWSMTAVTAFLVLRVNFYIATVFDQLLFTAKVQAPRSALVMANSYTALFNYVLPFGGVLMVPFVGWSLTDLGLGPSFFLIAILNETFSVVSTLNWIPIKYQVIAFVAYSANRPYLFGAMAAYLGRLFGFRNFGKLFGIARLAGALSTSLISTLTEIAKHKFGGDYFWVNVGFDVAGLLLFIFPVYLVHYVFYGFAIRPKDVPHDEDEEGEPSTSLA